MNNIDLMNFWIESANEITRFNLNSRYDDYKKEFSKKCTDEYTEEQINKIEEVKQWLENLLKEKTQSKE